MEAPKCGTLPDAGYRDLEAPLVRQRSSGSARQAPLVRQRFVLDPTHELGRLEGLTILDEAQSVPEVFSALRSSIDARRQDRRCHFCLLGSAQPALLRGISESLAGRVGVLELDPMVPAGHRDQGE